GDDDYMPGNILEIELHNFMTFDYLKCKPGPRLNLVIGPNGSGKSSLVCAIALGLCGEPQLLGRATSVGAYVKRGEESGHVKITLRGDQKEENITIMRNIVAKKDVAETIQRFNIQVNNLTQFLPQDRVCEFAKLTPVQLLEETEKAVGDPQLPEQHRALIDKSRTLKHVELSLEKNEGTLNQLKERNAELEKDVERVRQRDELLAKAESMKKKLPWLKYDMKQAEYREAKKREKIAAKEFQKAAKLLNELKEPINKQKDEKATLEAKCKKVNNRIDENAKKRMDLKEKENRLEVELQGKYKEMDELKRQEETRQQKFINAREELAAAELELKNLDPFLHPKDELSFFFDSVPVSMATSNPFLNSEGSFLSSHFKQWKQQIDGIIRTAPLPTADVSVLSQMALRNSNAQHRLKEMGNKSTNCLHALKRSGVEKIVDAYDWVKAHRHEFNKEVYGPVLLEVNVPDQSHAGYLEGQVAWYTWKSFITQDPRDRDFLVNNLRNFDVPVLNYTRDSRQREPPPEISPDMRALGVYSRLDQIFDAPFAVKEVLNSQSNLDRSFIGSKETDQKADGVPKLGITSLWTPENHYHWSMSRYGNHVSAIVEQVQRPKLLLNNLNVREIEDLKSQERDLKEQIASSEESVKRFKDEERSFMNQAANLRKQSEAIRREAQIKKQEREAINRRIEQKKAKLKLMEEQDDLDTELAKLADQATECNIQRFHNAIKIKDLLVEAAGYRRNYVEQRMTCIEFDAKAATLPTTS
ncbi:structural maintenance of chromosomes protein 5-like, partial [Trifolium pratense]